MCACAERMKAMNSDGGSVGSRNCEWGNRDEAQYRRNGERNLKERRWGEILLTQIVCIKIYAVIAWAFLGATLPHSMMLACCWGGSSIRRGRILFDATCSAFTRPHSCRREGIEMHAHRTHRTHSLHVPRWNKIGRQTEEIEFMWLYLVLIKPWLVWHCL